MSSAAVVTTESIVGASTVVSAEVLFAKRYNPADVEFFAVIMDNSPAVISLRDVKLFDEARSSIAAYEIQVGMQLLLHDVGRWNLKTCAMHNAKVSVIDYTIDGCNNQMDEQRKQQKPVVDEPTPTKRKPMSMSPASDGKRSNNSATGRP